MGEPRPAREARSDELEELAHAVRSELLRRGEAPAAGWIEEIVAELRSGRVTGWYLPGPGERGLAFFSVRGERAFGHVHVQDGADAVARAAELLNGLQRGLPPTVTTLDVGFTGLAPEEERRLGERLAGIPGVTLLARIAMERGIAPADADPVEPRPEGIHLRPIHAIPRTALARLDYQAFSGTVDANLIGTDPLEYRRMIDELIDGRMGRFLGEASTAITCGDPEELVGAILTSEQTPQLAVYLDVMVAPRYRRQGIGRYLVRWGFRALWALGYPRVRLWVTERNETARRLYESVGFAPAGTALIYRYARAGSAGTGDPPPAHG